MGKKKGTASGQAFEELRSDERLVGVFSSQSQAFIGFGATKRKVSQQVYVFVEENADGSLTVRDLNKNFAPSGASRTLTREALLKEFLPEPEIYLKKVLPVMREINASVDRADDHRQQGEYMSAEFEYKNALRLDEEHIRATFGLGLTYLAQGETESAKVVFRRVVSLDTAFDPEHKHLFNDFGIKLRKSSLYDQALRYYFRAAKLVADDEHLYYNIARTFFEKGKLKQAARFLDKALGLNADFGLARKFRQLVGERLAGPDDFEAMDFESLLDDMEKGT